jgi:cobyrinic acid a,c-diamide synthase
MSTPRLLISAAHKSSGKTTLSLALAAALCQRGLTVQPFKKGPDYIDPMWLGLASGRPCINLDPHLMSAPEITQQFVRRTAGADLALIEGNKGLYDGLALDGSNSNAALARQLEAPVLLVLDARGMTRGIAPLILGYQAFDRDVRIGGVLLNRVGGSRHESKLRAVIEHYTDVRVVGAVGEDPRIAMTERHLGLVPSNEAEQAVGMVERIRAAAMTGVDLDAVIALAHSAGPMTTAGLTALAGRRQSACPTRLRIAVAMDRAFGFYYPDDLEALREAGAELLPFDMLRDAHLPERIDALFIGGGFPESCAAELEANVSLRAEINAAICAGLPTYAECGGLMVLARGLSIGGRRYEMVGAIAGEVDMTPRPVGRGYVELEATGEMAWAVPAGHRIRAHEFHYSDLKLDAPAAGEPPLRFAWTVRRGHGIDGQRDGLMVHRLLASYTHLRRVGACDWPTWFVRYACEVRDAATRAVA